MAVRAPLHAPSRSLPVGQRCLCWSGRRRLQCWPCARWPRREGSLSAPGWASARGSSCAGRPRLRRGWWDGRGGGLSCLREGHESGMRWSTSRRVASVSDVRSWAVRPARASSCRASPSSWVNSVWWTVCGRRRCTRWCRRGTRATSRAGTTPRPSCGCGWTTLQRRAQARVRAGRWGRRRRRRRVSTPALCPCGSQPTTPQCGSCGPPPPLPQRRGRGQRRRGCNAARVLGVGTARRSPVWRRRPATPRQEHTSNP